MTASVAKLQTASQPAVEIERGLPIPTGAAGRAAKYPWERMEVGDSFLFPSNLPKASAYRIAHARIQNGKKFVVRTTADGMRCWRVA